MARALSMILQVMSAMAGRLEAATSWCARLLCVLACAWLGTASAAGGDTPAVPVMGCAGDDPTGSLNAPSAGPKQVAIDVSVAQQLAYYRAEHSPGVYAPKGWYCRAWYGSNGSILVVTPKRMEPPYFPLPAISGPAVMIESSDAGDSGRFHVAIVASQLFPLVAGELINRVRQEHLIPDSSFDLEPYPDDHRKYLSDRFVEYTTPANRTGLGTDGMFEMSNLPVRGLTLLNPQAEVNALIEVRVRLPATLNAVAQAIMQLETACVQTPRGCRGLK
jgi:hypothetical protein